jgi:hypothetical protein
MKDVIPISWFPRVFHVPSGSVQTVLIYTPVPIEVTELLPLVCRKLLEEQFKFGG